MANLDPTLRLVTLDEGHIASLLDIERASNGSPWSERSFRNELGNEHGIFRVALSQGKVVGYAGLWLLVDEAHVTTLAVAPDRRREGIGGRIIKEILREAKARGMVCATLEVRAGNEAALELYDGLGFEQRARRKGYYPDNGEDAVIMWLDRLDEWTR